MAPTLLNDHFLIAMPALADPNFARSVTYLCQHGEDGAMGIQINRASDYTLGEVLRHMRIEISDPELSARPVLFGGPVQGERGFVLHEGPQRWDSTLEVADGLLLTTSRDVLEAVAAGGGPRRMLVALGYCGWGPGQLERELLDNSWLSVPAQRGLMFEHPLEGRWQAALSLLGIDLSRLADYAGHA